MPLFISDEELLQSDPSSVAAKADEIIIDIRRQLDTVRAEADAASIASDQTYNVLEQRYASLSAEFASAQAECVRLSAAAEQRLAEIAEAHAAKHELHLKSIAKDGEVERLKVELSELHKSNRQLLELISQKDTELGEKNGLVQSYFDKIVKLTENANEKESRLQEIEADVNRCRATCARLLQEKELVEKHNKWLNEELTERVDSLLELRRTHMDFEADMATKVAETDRRFNECSGLLKQSEERVKENAIKLATLEEELTSCKDAAASAERQYSAELSTVSKLVELYKESAEAWSGKARDLEGVIKALETHLDQIETDYKSKLEEDTSIIKILEKDIQVQKEKLDKCEIELENTRKASEKNLLLGFSVHDDVPMAEVGCSEVTRIGSQHENTVLDILRKPVGISGTALAASLLRDGWSLAKMYEKYQEVADALRHEKWERKNAEAILERVFHEIEQKAEVILEERVEHEKMVETYNLVNQKLLQAQLEHDAYEASIRNLKAELKRCERDHNIVQKENIDLQRQVAVLLKECRDIQLRCGRAPNEPMSTYSAENAGGIDLEQLSFKDIIDLVQQNSQLRGLLQKLSSTEQAQISEMKENFQLELQKQETETSLRVEAVLKRCEEQGLMIESLHNSVAMYKKLYEEEHKVRKSGSVTAEAISAVGGNKNLLLLFEDSQELAKKAHEEVAMRTRSLEQDLSNLRNELLAMQLERDKFAMEAKQAREKLDGLMMEFDRQKNEANEISSRSVELSQLVIDHQRKLRESADSLLASEDRCRKFSVEVSVLKNEKELFLNSEKRASDEIRNLTERVYRLQSNLDTIQGVEEVREESRLRERRKLEESVQQIEKDWAQAKKELQEQRDHLRLVEAERDRVIEDSLKQVNEMRTELSDALHALSSAEVRAVIAEERCTNLEASMKTVDKTTFSGKGNIGSSLILNEECCNEWNAHEEMEKVKEEADANRSYMLQYKEIAHANEIALKQMEFAHEEFKREAEKLRGSLESEILTLRERVAELEFECISKGNEAFSAIVTKEEAISAAALEVQHLKEENSAHLAKVFELESQILSLKDNLEREHERWRSSQNNYERQVVLQSETIQELTKTSQTLASLQDEVSVLRSQSDTLKSENELLKSSWQAERSSLMKSKEDTERNFKKIDEQNNILHKQLESLHVKYTMKELSSTGQISSVDKSSENDVQNVMSYLRRAKEIAETEITLLRQEKLRLQSQLDMALKSSERAQSLLHSERENAKAHLYSDEEFNSLKLQVREINLLRESNAELRAENKHNFEECQRLHEIVQNAKVEAEQLARDRDISTQGYEKEIEVLKIAKMKLESELTELNAKYMSIDIAEFKHVKDELQLTAVKLAETESETSLLKKLLAEKEENLNISEKKLVKCQRELDEQQKTISQEETKVEQLVKEKEDLVRENQLLHKKLEESLAANKIVSGSASEVPIKEIEKDTRIQMLEKTVERLRDYLRKEKEESKREKALRMKNEKLLITRAHMSHQEKRKLEDEMRTLKLHIHNNLNCGIAASQLPNESDLEERSIAYFSSVDKYDEVANRVHGDGYIDLSLPTDSTASDATISVPDNQVPSKQETHVIQPVDNREKGPVKMNVDGRKVGRKLNRPRLKQSEETAIDMELSEMEGSTTCTEGKLADSREEESCATVPSRKRSSSLTVLESKEDYVRRELGSEAAPLLKKIKESESPPRVAELQVSSELGQSSNSLPLVEQIPIDSAEHGELITDEKLNDADAGLKEEPGELKDVVALEMYSNLESDLVPKFPDKSSEGIRLLDNATKGNEAMESFLPVLSEEMEEGEMVPDELELQPYEGESLQSQAATGEAAVTDTDGGLEVAVANEANNVVDEVTITEPGKTIPEQSISDKEETHSTLAEHDPADIQGDTTSALEQGSPGMVTEGVKQTSESEATRTSARIVITERARQNAQLRQAGMATRAQARASARGGLRRDAGRGRGGRGTNLGDKEQQGS